MRLDMHKVMTRSRRSTSRGRYRPSDLQDVDGELVGAPREAMHLPYRAGTDYRYRGQRASYKVLMRFLASRVGQAWSLVYAELRTVFKDVSSDDAFRRAVSNVAVSTFLDVDGVVKAGTTFAGVQVAADWFDFYVHPVTGHLLSGTPRPPAEFTWAERKAREVMARRRDIDASTQAHLVGGIWYEVRLAPLAPLVHYTHLQESAYGRRRRSFSARSIADPKSFDDALLGGTSDYSRGELERLYGRKDVVGVSKRQLNHRELVKLGIVTQ